MEELRRIDSKNIRFEYADGLNKDTTGEQALTNNINMWFSPHIDNINAQYGIINVFFPDERNNRMHFDSMDSDLQTTLYREAGL